MNAADRIRIRHMLDAAAEAAAFIAGRTSADLSRDRMLLLALVKEIEVVGEAATQISEELRAGAPEVPWVKIKGMRNRLIHAYSDVNIELVWSTVISDLPDLVRGMKELPLARSSFQPVRVESALPPLPHFVTLLP